ncbi:DUF3100 domain-containing protein [Pseudonocardia acaciae]|uniref:DUF3100 domain-containing protein n=1 Tax=Pseudonocardia acaciae TaxID=551276 RepID=UPI00048F3C67|nr:DUF3100 domain-containing protein [Pseudonocardia acaciae]
MSAEEKALRTRSGIGWRVYLPLALVCVALTGIAQLIGSVTLNIGIGSVVLSPVIWAILMGGLVSIQKIRAFPLRMQRFAGYFMEASVLILIAKVGFLAGANLPELVRAGPAMLTQELGHLFGTLVLSLPLAVILGMGRPAIGACFSIDRETSFSMVTERYGASSPEYNGVLAMYVFGTVFGALFMSVLASFLAGYDIFDPLALAMGTGVGSASMMIAAATAIADQYPAVREQVLTLGSVSSLATAVFGIYVSKYLALPLAHRFYSLLAGRRRRDDAPPAIAATAAASVEPDGPAPSRWLLYPLLLVPLALATAMSGAKPDAMRNALVGLLVLTAVVIVASYLHRVARISTMILVASIGCLLASPVSPLSGVLNAFVGQVSLSTIGVVSLAIAGLGLGKDWALLRGVGWRVVPVGLVSIASSFLFATVIAHVVLGVA